MKQWHAILQKALEQGVMRPDRTGVGTLALFGEQLEFDTAMQFPAVTTKTLAFRQMAAELACFLHGFETLDEFHSMGCTIWDGNGTAEAWQRKAPQLGSLGRIYGVQWRRWQSVVWSPDGQAYAVFTDQLQKLLSGLQYDPDSRRHIVTALNPGEMDQMCLPPCHVLFQCFIADGALSLRVDMRSVDLFLGLPFDIASYALLQRLIAKELGIGCHKLIFQLGDAHIYMNHQDQVREVLTREIYAPPMLLLHSNASLFNFHPTQATMVNYSSHGPVPAPLNI